MQSSTPRNLIDAWDLLYSILATKGLLLSYQNQLVTESPALGPDLLLPLLSIASGLLDSIATHYSYNHPNVIRMMGRRLCHS